jgi:hypothetical protein
MAMILPFFPDYARIEFFQPRKLDLIRAKHAYNGLKRIRRDRSINFDGNLGGARDR